MPTTQSITGLFIGWYEVFDEGRVSKGEGWCVLFHQAAEEGRGALCRPFASKRDAEIGMNSLSACGVDWTASVEDVVRDVRSRGGRQFIDRVAYENLSW